MVNAEYDAQSVNSAAQSITSVNSLASLLKEKMQVSRRRSLLQCRALNDVDLCNLQALPSMIRKRKKPQDYKLRSFVAILFLIIVFLVS